ncbi:MAG: hypothetical protein QOJ25_1393 [Solirubrobacteraceae bacterium]|jgi:hypothetical protein|nr:hypothetical protein [Solirubrobacteraceae bacterium]
MPQYMLMINLPTEGGLSPEEQLAERPRWYEYTVGLQEAGVHVAGDALHDLDTATTVRVRDGETQITDGPFAETKEFLGGYYVIDVPDLDTALEHAARIPSVGRGSVEVRPVVDMSTMPGFEAETAGQAAEA